MFNNELMARTLHKRLGFSVSLLNDSWFVGKREKDMDFGLELRMSRDTSSSRRAMNDDAKPIQKSRRLFIETHVTPNGSCGPSFSH